MHNQRTHPRVLAFRATVISFEGGRRLIQCIIEDISTDGAKILVSDTCGIPSEFRIAVTDHHWRPCFVRWRKRATLGVRFLPQNLATLDSVVEDAGYSID